MSFLDQLAEENVGLISGEIHLSFDDEARIAMCKTFEMKDEEKAVLKEASFGTTFGRIDQEADVDLHQNDEIPDIWVIKQGKLLRVASDKNKRG